MAYISGVQQVEGGVVGVWHVWENNIFPTLVSLNSVCSPPPLATRGEMISVTTEYTVECTHMNMYRYLSDD